MKIQIRTLQQKTFLFVLLPTFFFLTVLGWGGYIFAKQSILTQWSETADANLQKAAHLVDMRLARPKDLLERLRFSSGTGMAHLTLRFTLEQLEKLDGVSAVNLNPPLHETGMMSMMGAGGGHRFAEPLTITSPKYIWNTGDESIALVSKIIDAGTGDQKIIRVIITVADLVEQVAQEEWWKGSEALLVDMEGNVIAQSSRTEEMINSQGKVMFGNEGMLERKTLSSLQENTHGTVFGEGNPPDQISGYYRLSDVPWSMVVISPGDVVLQPIERFSLYYGVLFITAIIVIIFFIRSMTSKMTNSIQKLSVAAESLANGVFSTPLDVESSDEIGELTQSFNTMTSQLKKGLVLEKSMEIAREVQQNFLPDSRYSDEGLEIYGSCRYCQETGGDFYDFVYPSNLSAKVGVVVGDVVGHGVGAALLMASVRAILRARIDQEDEPAQVIGDVNRVLCADTQEISNFVTLFYLVVDKNRQILEWVRAGHEPALLIYPDRHQCIELYGEGVAVGIDPKLSYTSSLVKITAEKQFVIIVSDGAWEAENNKGERFGKERLIDLLMAHGGEEPEYIVERVNQEIDVFLGDSQPQDDITFVVVKIDGEHLHAIQNI